MQNLNTLSKRQIDTKQQKLLPETKQEIPYGYHDLVNEALKNKSVYGDRRQLIDRAAQERTALLISNPYLDAEISGKGTNRGNLKVMFKTLSDAVADPKSPIDKQTRSSMNLAIRNVADFLNLAEDPELSNRFDFSEMKSNRKQQVVKILTELSKINPEVKIVETNDEVPNAGYTFDSTKIKKTGFKFLYNLENSLQEKLKLDFVYKTLSELKTDTSVNYLITSAYEEWEELNYSEISKSLMKNFFQIFPFSSSLSLFIFNQAVEPSKQ
jgi:hypothetical protein